MAASLSAVVVGGGPAGLMAAQTLATADVRVEVVEHRRSVGRKFLLAGRGGLNLTNAAPVDVMVDRYGGGVPVADAVRAFSPDALMRWCAQLGEPTFSGTSGHVFPASFRATPLLRAWLQRLRDLGVVITTDTAWTGWDERGRLDFGDGVDRLADVAVLALGGASWPRTGSDGRWVPVLREDGHAVADLVASNAGVRVSWSDVHRRRFAGKAVKNVRVTVGSISARGDLMTTETGLEGGPIYAVGAAMRAGADRMVVDLRPDLEVSALRDRLAATGRPKDSASTWLRRAGFDPQTISMLREAAGTRIERDPVGLAATCKALVVRIDGLAPIDRAISSAGGVTVDAIDEHFMLRARPGVFVAGEMLDWDAPTGGYLLQAACSTGVAAARSAIAYARDRGRA